MSADATTRALVIIASRDGEIRTVTEAEAAELTARGGWIVICREPESEAPTAPPTKPGTMNLLIRVHHHHNYGTPQPGCPESAYISVPDSLDRWTIQTLADISERAAAILNSPRIQWQLRTADGKRGRRTVIALGAFNEQGQPIHNHRATITLPGFPVFAVAEFLRHLQFELTFTYGAPASPSRRPKPNVFLDTIRRIQQRLEDLRREDDDTDDDEAES